MVRPQAVARPVPAPRAVLPSVWPGVRPGSRSESDLSTLQVLVRRDVPFIPLARRARKYGHVPGIWRSFAFGTLLMAGSLAAHAMYYLA